MRNNKEVLTKTTNKEVLKDICLQNPATWPNEIVFICSFLLTCLSHSRHLSIMTCLVVRISRRDFTRNNMMTMTAEESLCLQPMNNQCQELRRRQGTQILMSVAPHTPYMSLSLALAADLLSPGGKPDSCFYIALITRKRTNMVSSSKSTSPREEVIETD